MTQYSTIEAYFLPFVDMLHEHGYDILHPADLYIENLCATDDKDGSTRQYFSRVISQVDETPYEPIFDIVKRHWCMDEEDELDFCVTRYILAKELPPSIIPNDILGTRDQINIEWEIMKPVAFYIGKETGELNNDYFIADTNLLAGICLVSRVDPSVLSTLSRQSLFFFKLANISNIRVMKSSFENEQGIPRSDNEIGQIIQKCYAKYL